MTTSHIDEEWTQYLLNISNNSSFGSVDTSNRGVSTLDKKLETVSINDVLPIKTVEQYERENEIPVCEDLYISTKTKVLYLNKEIDIHRIFWLLPMIENWRPTTGIIKKQMKIVSKSKEEYEEYCKKLEGIDYYTEHIIKQIDNPSARRIKFKDERKITIGLSKKDIMNCRGKVKNAFYNCFAMILRFKMGEDFKEIHVKIFNTGKLEIPGILNNHILEIVKKMILDILQPHISTELTYIDIERGDENVLINSNFNCGFYINRTKLHAILRSEKYRIESAYDPCSYPGVKCKFYFNNEKPYTLEAQPGLVMPEDRGMKMSELIDSKKYTEISFMIFRTGSCLIVGNCSERILRIVFDFIKGILVNEYSVISVLNDNTNIKLKKTKLRKKTILMTSDYFDKITQV
jgi:hypothetical protein